MYSCNLWLQKYIPAELLSLNNIFYFYSAKHFILLNNILTGRFLLKFCIPMAKNRNYSYSDVNMIMAAKIIAANFKANLPELSTLRTNWTNEYASDLAGRINHAIENYLGFDAKKELRNATLNLHSRILLYKKARYVVRRN